MQETDHWPQPEHDDLRAVVDGFRSRSKAIHHHGSTALSSGSEHGMEWVQVIFTPEIHDWPEVELSLWEDFTAEVQVRSRKRKVLGKKLLWLEGVRFQRRPLQIVEAFLSTVRAGPSTASLAPCLESWTGLEEKQGDA